MVDVPQIDIEAAVRQFVAGATGLALDKVVKGNQSAPSPNGEYATVLSVSIDQNGTDWNVATETATVGELDNATVGSREASFSVQFYRGNVFRNARQVIQYAKTPNGQFLLQQNGLAWRRESDIIQLDAVDQGGKWETRTVLTLNFGFTEKTAQVINALESAEMTFNYSGETDIQETINVIAN